MNLVNYEPWTALRKMRNDINSLFNPEADANFSGDVPEFSFSSWWPAVDIQEDDNAYRINADLPGIDPKDVEITAENGVLTLSGERELKKDEGKDFRRVERHYGSFVRRFTLPAGADADNITAEARNGTLEITVPKSEKARPKRIEVKS